MSDYEAWVAAVGAAYQGGEQQQRVGEIEVVRLDGGANNALYRVAVGGQWYACKICVPDERQRAVREYRALGLLQAAGLDRAPVPLWLDARCEHLPYPVVIYAWVAGDPLPVVPSAVQWAGLVESVQEIHGVRPGVVPGFDDLPEAILHWFDVGRYIEELEEFLALYGPWLVANDPEGQVLVDRLARLIEGCAAAGAGVERLVARAQVPVCLCRVDPNLANAIWGLDGRVRWIDWEYSGWGDPALELADLRWAASLEAVSAEAHGWLRAQYRPPAGDEAFGVRLAYWDRVISARWAFLFLRALWSGANGPDRLRLSQTRPPDMAALRVKLVRFLARAEVFQAGGGGVAGSV